MTSAGKVGVGAAALGGSGGAIGYGVKYVLEMEPNFVPLSKSSSPNTYESGKLGAVEANKSLFADPDQNEEWWNWVYKNLLDVDKKNQIDEVYSDFQPVTKGYSSTEDTTSLNQVCKTAFKKESKTVVNIKYKKNIWKYCSKDRDDLKKHEEAPAAATLTSGDSTKLSGAAESNKDKLVDDVANNEEWWNWVYENKFNVDKSKTPNDLSSEFNSVSKSYSSSEGTALNKVCKASHSKTKADFSDDDANKKKYKKNIELYCTKEGNEGSLKIPTT